MGHTVLLGSSATTYLGSAFGATGLLVGAGVAGAATGVAYGARKLGLRKGNNRGASTATRSTGLTSRTLGLGGRGRRTGSGPGRGNSRGGGGGLLGTTRNRRNGTRTGSGLPGSGRTRSRGVTSRNGATGLPGSTTRRKRSPFSGSTRPGSKRPGGGSRVPGSTRGRGRGLFSGSTRPSSKRPGGKNPSRGRGGTKNGSGGLFSRWRNPNNNTKGKNNNGGKNKHNNGGKNKHNNGNKNRLFGKLKDAYGKAKYNLGSDRDRDIARRTQWGAIEHGPAVKPLSQPKKVTPTINQGENDMSRFSRKSQIPSAAAATGGATAAGAGRVSQAAEQMAQAIKDPGIDTKLLGNIPRYFGDVANAQKILAESWKAAIAKYEEQHPDDRATVERMQGQLNQMLNIAQGIEGVSAHHRRANAADYERIEAPRKDEEGRDYGANKHLY